MRDTIVLVTSIAPKGIENQQRAITSWTENGFKVVSCNIDEEIEALEKSFPNVEFVKIERDSRKINGKPCPYIYDMLQILKRTGTEIGGIINSDIHLEYFSTDMYDYLYEHAKKNMVFLRRQEVRSLCKEDKKNGTVFFGGIDTFIFPINFIDLVEDEGLILGQAMWDYWFPIVLKEKGISLKEFINPVTFHVSHVTRWDDSLTEGIAYRICKNHFSAITRENAVEYLKDKFFSIISSPEEQLCYLPRQWKDKCVLVNGTKLDDKNKKRLQDSGVKVVFDHKKKEEINYMIDIPYHTVVSAAFVGGAVWTMETYDMDEMRIPVYWRGNSSDDVVIENCNVLLHRKFNQEIQPIIMRRAGQEVGQHMNVNCKNSCSICIATVLIEDDEQVIWNREKMEGRVLLFPAGFIARKWIKRYSTVAKEIKIVGWIDNNPALWNTEICGKKVFCPQDILDRQDQYDKIFIISNLYAEEIYKSLKETVPEKKLVIWNEYDGKKWKKMQVEQESDIGR